MKTDDEESERLFRRAITLRPDESTAQRNLACVLFWKRVESAIKAGQDTVALPLMEQMVSLVPSEAWMLQQLSQLYRRLKRVCWMCWLRTTSHSGVSQQGADGEAALRSAIQADPNHFYSIGELARYLAEQQRVRISVFVFIHVSDWAAKVRRGDGSWTSVGRSAAAKPRQ
jgi:cytochrome c-type biogenesis protein CcmH/NrfG